MILPPPSLLPPSPLTPTPPQLGGKGKAEGAIKAVVDTFYGRLLKFQEVSDDCSGRYGISV